jgi:cell division protein FtsB
VKVSADLRLPKLGRSPQVVAFVLVLGLLGAMAIEPTRQLIDQRVRISSVAGELRELQEGNAQLQAQIARLNNDDYIEQRAREQIGLVRPGETTYVVMPPSDQEQAADRKKHRRKVEAEPPPPPSFLESAVHFIFGF